MLLDRRDPITKKITMAALEITGLEKRFGGVVALNGVDLSVDSTRITGIIGPNGSGKTTLFNVIVGSHKPSAGRVTWRGNDITGKSTAAIASQGLVRTFQQAMSFSALSVRENVAIACEHGRPSAAAGVRWRSPEDILDFVGLSGLGHQTAGSMPFGNLRRLGIAIALGTNPLLLLLDEPAAGLNQTEVAQLMELIVQLPKVGIGVCLIDHDMFLMSGLCERLTVLNFGTKIAEGSPQEVLNHSKVKEVYLGGEL
jgi:branched-chain amino acid transport system ATP-binding protein